MRDKNAVKNVVMDLLCDIGGSVLYSVGIYTFAKMANFAPGGLSGLALIINYLWGNSHRCYDFDFEHSICTD